MSTPSTPTIGSPTDETAADTDTMMRRDGYLPPDEAAIDLGCGKRWLLDGLNKHGFPHTRMGRAKWLSPEDRAEIRKLCRIPAEPAKISRLRRASRKPARAAA